MELDVNEKEYYYDVLDAMRFGFIDSDMKEHLKESKIDNKISDERARELEKLARDEQISSMEELKNDSERRYYKEYIKMMDDGIISESERINLNNKKNRLYISDSRANEIEELYYNKIKPQNTEIVINEKNTITDNKKSKEVKEAEIDEKDKKIGILKRWKYLNKTKFINFHIFNILIILAFEIYFFIRLKGTLNNPKPAPTTFFEKFADMVKDLNGVQTNLSKAMTKLTGRDNVIRQCERLTELGAKNAKQIPAPALNEENPQTTLV